MIKASDHSGVIERLREWVDRRLSERRQANFHVLVLQGTRVQSGILINMSDDGFGLDKVIGLVVNELISVMTDDGKVMDGRVVWTKNGQAGARLVRSIW